MNIITWNSQGYKPEQIDSILDLKSIDVLCVQEAGSGPPFAQNLKMVGIGDRICLLTGKYNENYYRIDWDNDLGKGQNGRCSIMIFIKEEIFDKCTLFACHATYDGKTQYGLRPLIGFVYNSDLISTTHCPSTSNRYPKVIRNNFVNMILSNWNSDWQMVGDFNYSASEPDQDLPAEATILYVPHEQAQKSGGELDYMVKKSNGAIFCAQVGDYMGSDHKVVFFTQ